MSIDFLLIGGDGSWGNGLKYACFWHSEGRIWAMRPNMGWKAQATAEELHVPHEHGVAALDGGLRAHHEFGDFEGELDGGAGALAGDEFAVVADSGVAVFHVVVEAAFQAGEAGGVFAGEDAKGREDHGGGGADGGDEAALFVVAFDELGDEVGLVEVFGTFPAAGDDEGVEKDFAEFLDGAVGAQGDMVAADEVDAVGFAGAGDARVGDVNTGAVENITGGDGLDLFGSIGDKNDGGLAHGQILRGGSMVKCIRGGNKTNAKVSEKRRARRERLS